MKVYNYLFCGTIILLSVFAQTLYAQKNVSGKIFDARTNEPLIGASVVVKGSIIGGVTDPEGAFDFNPQQKPPFTLAISFVGYASQELNITTDTKIPVSLKLSDASEVKDAVEVIGQRVSDKTKQSQLTVESMDKIAIKNTTGVTFYEGLANLKGVDATTASLGFTVINTRGFNSTSPVRSLQIIDGVDNQSPGLNFSLGNFLGSSELDVLKVDLVVGASSAYYGPNAFNGVISLTTKSPFYSKGLSAQLKTGERSLVETAFRFADALKNSKGKDWFGYKFNFYRIQAHDWVADNSDPVYKSLGAKSNPGGYDAVNVYGDEYNASFDYTGYTKSQPWLYPGLGEYHRTGYKESDLVDYNVNNIKLNAAFHFRLNPDMEDKSPEVIFSSNFGNGNTVYQGDNRFALKDILFFQNRIELRQNDKYFIRAYATNEDAGKSYDPYFTALILQDLSKQPDKWGPNYASYWDTYIVPKENEMGYPKLKVNFDPVTGNITTSFDQDAANKFLSTHQDSLIKWHNDARNFADTANTNNPYFVPGTQRFTDQFNRITSTKSSKRDIVNGGTGLYDKSALYHIQGEYHFTPGFVNDLTVGGNYRKYTPNSAGTIFYDTAGNKITNSEFGIYTGIEKKFSDNKFKFNATLRMDKNQNFGYLFSPATSLVYQPNNKDFFRFSLSSAIRNPTLNDQYLFLNVGPAILAGNVEGQTGLITTASFINYINSNFTTKKDFFSIAPIRPEKVKSAEIGYRTTLFNNTYIDASYYYSLYTDFIGYQIGIRSDFSSTGFPLNTQVYRYAANAKQDVTTQGFSIGISHYFAKYFQLSGNYSFNKLNAGVTDSIIPAYNTPENKFNIGISGRDLTLGKLQHFGFNFNYKWIQGFLYEGSPQFTGLIPTYDLLDGQVNFGFPKINSTVKIGASNILNKLQFQTYGGPRIGRMAYISLLYDFVKK